MTKKETIWRHIIMETLKEPNRHFTQKELAFSFGYSTCTVFNSLKTARRLGAIEVTGRFFRVRDASKLLLLWATERNMERDLLYATHSDLNPIKIESNMPQNIIYAAFSAYRIKYGNAPADYSIVYVYSDNIAEIKKRFPGQKGYPNLFVLKPDSHLKEYGQTTPDAQTFVDLWNVREWYAKDFLAALKQKMGI